MSTVMFVSLVMEMTDRTWGSEHESARPSLGKTALVEVHGCTRIDRS